MNFDSKWFAIGVIIGLVFSAVSWAITTDQIWQAVYNSSNSSIRVTVVP
jgi:hypothetical protein